MNRLINAFEIVLLTCVARERCRYEHLNVASLALGQVCVTPFLATRIFKVLVFLM